MKVTDDTTDRKADDIYTFVQGFNVGDLCTGGGTIRLILKPRDSRSVWEPWRDGDYTYTIYFDQVLTFGSEAESSDDGAFDLSMNEFRQKRTSFRLAAREHSCS